ncbi:hypothetical protein ZIOFF_056651 [Zingiber officinale]|uniref:Uncharacterized protein n=1 Tax=Zingiber officinale TaxID=94328 RepID=A0A8J5FMD9_ZINOF|nr:hypothetical protein ZIOFF_056651 [Zingiber officinale]
MKTPPPPLAPHPCIVTPSRSIVIGVHSTDAIVLDIKDKSTPNDPANQHSIRHKIVNLDAYIMLVCASVKADTHMHSKHIYIECQSQQLNMEDSNKVKYITRNIINLEQKSIQSSSMHLFGLSMFIVEFGT